MRLSNDISSVPPKVQLSNSICSALPTVQTLPPANGLRSPLASPSTSVDCIEIAAILPSIKRDSLLKRSTVGAGPSTITHQTPSSEAEQQKKKPQPEIYSLNEPKWKLAGDKQSPPEEAEEKKGIAPSEELLHPPIDLSGRESIPDERPNILNQSTTSKGSPVSPAKRKLSTAKRKLSTTPVARKKPRRCYNHLKIYYDERCNLHRISDPYFSEHFKENPERLTGLIEMIHEQKWDQKAHVVGKIEDSEIPKWKEIAGHELIHLRKVKKACNRAKGDGWVCIDVDTYCCRGTPMAIRVASGLVEMATCEVLDPDSQITRVAALVRPPGHHCNGKKAHGFCHVNHTAHAIERVISKSMKVAILDVDVHHGDGMQAKYYKNPNILTISVHRYDGQFFPGSGCSYELGPSQRHQAFGRNINIPLLEGAGDHDLLYAFRKVLFPIINEFNPEIIFYACGTDGIAGDKCGAGINYSPYIFGQIAYELKSLPRIVLVTQGGYTVSLLKAGIDCALLGLCEDNSTCIYGEDLSETTSNTKDVVNSIIFDLRNFYYCCFQAVGAKKNEIERENRRGK